MNLSENSWFFLAILSPALFALVNILDDNLLRKVYRSPYFAAIISGFFGLFPIVALPFIEFQIPSLFVVTLGITAGFLTVMYYLLYFKSLELEYPSVVIAMFALAPAIVPFLAYIFFKEVLTINQYIGFVLILSASFAISDINLKKLKVSKVFLLILLASIIYACISIISKSVYNHVNFWSGYIFFSIGMGIGALTLVFIPKQGRMFFGDLKKQFKKWIIIFALVEFVGIAAEFTNNLAISRGPVALVKVIEGIQPMYVLLFALLFYPVFPKYLREATAGNKLKKITLMTIMILGLYLINK